MTMRSMSQAVGAGLPGQYKQGADPITAAPGSPACMAEQRKLECTKLITMPQFVPNHKYIMRTSCKSHMAYSSRRHEGAVLTRRPRSWMHFMLHSSQASTTSDADACTPTSTRKHMPSGCDKVPPRHQYKTHASPTLHSPVSFHFPRPCKSCLASTSFRS